MQRAKTVQRDPLTRVLATYRKPERQSFDDAWVGLEPTFQTRRCIELCEKFEHDDRRYFEHPYMLGKLRAVARRMKKRVRKALKQDPRPDWCFFSDVKHRVGVDKWKQRREQIDLRWADKDLEDFELKFGMDPSTFEFGIKPVPLQWLYDERFVELLEVLAFGAPRKEGMSVSMLNGGGQFHVSAKTLLGGSLLADVIATALNHPELSTWVLDWPNCDDRALRATAARRASFEEMLERYWAGAFHPKARGALKVGDVLFGKDLAPAPKDRRSSMDPARGPRGSAREIFQTNFAFGRAIKDFAQSVHPGYWQLSRPDDDGFRPEQIMRYSECNLARLQIAGELHVKDFSVLGKDRIPQASAELEIGMLAPEASFELRRHMSRTSARDQIDAVLFELHLMKYLAQHPHVKVTRSLLQDQLLADGEATLRKYGGARALDRLRKKSREENLSMSGGRLASDFIEPEKLFFAVWRHLPAKEKGAIAREVVTAFIELVEQAASVDPRSPKDNPMEAHRHRVHPLLWHALDAIRLPARNPARRELEAWKSNQKEHLARRPIFSQTGDAPPWKSA